jgi:hypothetical protein
MLPYLDIIQEYTSQTASVFDKPDIIHHLMKAVDQVGRDENSIKGKVHKNL